MLRITFRSELKFIEQMKLKGPQIVQVLSTKLNALMFMLGTYVVTEKLSGQVLHPRSGMLRGSVRAIPATAEGTKITAGVEVGGGPVLYAAAHEFGGTHPFEILPVKARALRFIAGGKTIFAKSVSHPPLPARPYLQPSLDENAEKIRDGLNEAIAKVIEGGD